MKATVKVKGVDLIRFGSSTLPQLRDEDTADEPVTVT